MEGEEILEAAQGYSYFEVHRILRIKMDGSDWIIETYIIPRKACARGICRLNIARHWVVDIAVDAILSRSSNEKQVGRGKKKNGCHVYSRIPKAEQPGRYASSFRKVPKCVRSPRFK
jgi:hypothetical protein